MSSTTSRRARRAMAAKVRREAWKAHKAKVKAPPRPTPVRRRGVTVLADGRSFIHDDLCVCPDCRPDMIGMASAGDVPENP